MSNQRWIPLIRDNLVRSWFFKKWSFDKVADTIIVLHRICVIFWACILHRRQNVPQLEGDSVNDSHEQYTVVTAANDGSDWVCRKKRNTRSFYTDVLLLKNAAHSEIELTNIHIFPPSQFLKNWKFTYFEGHTILREEFPRNRQFFSFQNMDTWFLNAVTDILIRFLDDFW